VTGYKHISEVELEERAAAAHRTVTEQRAFERAYEETAAQLKKAASQPMPAATFEPSTPAYLVPDQLRALPRGDRGVWYRSTAAGMLRAVTEPDPPDESAQEAKAARELADWREYTYGNRPSMTQARAAVSRRSDGVWLSGEARDFGAVFRQAGLRYAVIDVAEPLPAEPTAIIHQPVSR
jgi:hypothetical protein